MVTPAGTGEMYLSIAWSGECTINVPGIDPITEAAGGVLIVKVNEACTEGLWYSYISGDVDMGELAVDFATGDIFTAVRRVGRKRGRGEPSFTQLNIHPFRASTYRTHV